MGYGFWWFLLTAGIGLYVTWFLLGALFTLVLLVLLSWQKHLKGRPSLPVTRETWIFRGRDVCILPSDCVHFEVRKDQILFQSNSFFEESGKVAFCWKGTISSGQPIRFPLRNFLREAKRK